MDTWHLAKYTKIQRIYENYIFSTYFQNLQLFREMLENYKISKKFFLFSCIKIFHFSGETYKNVQEFRKMLHFSSERCAKMLNFLEKSSRISKKCSRIWENVREFEKMLKNFGEMLQNLPEKWDFSVKMWDFSLIWVVFHWK